MLDAARNKVRVKACYVMMAVTIGACLLMVVLGKRVSCFFVFFHVWWVGRNCAPNTVEHLHVSQSLNFAQRPMSLIDKPWCLWLR